VNAYKKILNNDAVVEVNRMRVVAVSVGQEGPFNIDAGEWFKNSTARINALKEIENLVTNEFITDINKLLD
jgi:methyl-accepting chemotaxis protein